MIKGKTLAHNLWIFSALKLYVLWKRKSNYKFLQILLINNQTWMGFYLYTFEQHLVSLTKHPLNFCFAAGFLATMEYYVESA